MNRISIPVCCFRSHCRCEICYLFAEANNSRHYLQHCGSHKCWRKYGWIATNCPRETRYLVFLLKLIKELARLDIKVVDYCSGPLVISTHSGSRKPNEISYSSWKFYDAQHQSSAQLRWVSTLNSHILYYSILFYLTKAHKSQKKRFETYIYIITSFAGVRDSCNGHFDWSSCGTSQ